MSATILESNDFLSAVCHAVMFHVLKKAHVNDIVLNTVSMHNLKPLNDISVPPTSDVSTIVVLLISGSSNVAKVKAIPLQAWTGIEGSRRLRVPEFKIISTLRW